jgi:hypothetical protein
MIQAMGPYNLLAKVTATASEPRTSVVDRVVWKAMIVRTYMTRQTMQEIAMALGRSLTGSLIQEANIITLVLSFY